MSRSYAPFRFVWVECISHDQEVVGSNPAESQAFFCPFPSLSVSSVSFNRSLEKMQHNEFPPKCLAVSIWGCRHIQRKFLFFELEFFIPWEQLFERLKNMVTSRHILRVIIHRVFIKKTRGANSFWRWTITYPIAWVKRLYSYPNLT